jgi:hypothetical protein
MKDHNFVDDTGRHIPTAQLPTAQIQELLRTGVEIVSTDGQVASPESVMERLRIELRIRELGLR